MGYKYDAVFFDFDGTIADTAQGIYASVDYASDAMNLERTDEAGHEYFVGPPLTESFEVIFGLHGEDVVTAIKKYREYYVQGGMFKLEFYPGILSFLDELKKAGIKTAVCSNKPSVYVNKILENYGIKDKFDVISCPINDTADETKQVMITNAYKALNVDKSKVLMLGDRYLDMEGAVSAGVDGCGAAYGYGTPEELTEAGAKYIAYSVNDVKAIVFSQEDK